MESYILQVEYNMREEKEKKKKQDATISKNQIPISNLSNEEIEKKI